MSSRLRRKLVLCLLATSLWVCPLRADAGRAAAASAFQSGGIVAQAAADLPAAASDAAAAAVLPPWQLKPEREWLLVFVLLIGGAVVGFIAWARAGHPLYVRPIPGLEAVTEAVGRATEMGRDCLFVAGIQDINEIETVAGVTVLGRVAQLTAEYGCGLEVPTSRALVMTAAREAVQGACLSAGRPEAYREDDIYYLSDEQFGFVAGVTGRMVREKPAACFYMGMFFAESLFLAETGNSIGAIQIAGTAQPSQLPFFVAACDYTLLGEEFFAASAYLSGEPVQLGSLRGQDVGKLVAIVLILVGCLAATLSMSDPGGSGTAMAEYITENVLGNQGIRP